MKIKNKIIAVLAASMGLGFFGSDMAKAQISDSDMFRLSSQNLSGTPRFSAMGGAFGALGANFSALSTNPAGLGLYSRSEFSISGGVSAATGKALYYSEELRDMQTRFALPSLGFVWLLYDNENSDIKRVQIAIGANKLNDYNSIYMASGINGTSSFMEAIAESNRGLRPAGTASDKDPGNLTSYGRLAWDSYLLDYDQSGDFAYTTFLKGSKNRQTKAYYTYGNLTEFDLAASFNAFDRLYIGVNIAVPIADFSSVSEITEQSLEDPIKNPYNFKSYTYKERRDVSAVGATLKIGAIYQALDFMRIGAWFHTPTVFSVSESNTISFNSSLNLPVDTLTNTTYGVTEGSESGTYYYKITSPARGGVALGFIVGSCLAIDVEGEMLNYSKMDFSMNTNVEFTNSLNKIVGKNYKFAGVFRAGLEYKFAKMARLRAGYAFQSNPFKPSDFNSLSKVWSHHSVSAGLGFGSGYWSLDLAVTYCMNPSQEYIYNMWTETSSGVYKSLVEPISLKNNKLFYSMGVSFKF